MFWSLISKQNCMNLSNQIDSLLVTSSIRESNRKQYTQMRKQNYSVKKQNKLNSDHLIKETKRHSIQSQMRFLPSNQDNHISVKENTNKHYNNKSNTNNIANKNIYNDLKQPMQMQTCSHCKQELPIINQKLSHTINRLQQLQSMFKLCFTKTMTIESTVKDSNSFLIDVKMRVQENQNQINKNQQSFIKTIANNKLELNQMKQIVDKLSQGMTHKNKQIKEILQLQKIQLNQKIEKLSMNHQQRFEALINMVEQLAKSQQQRIRNKSQQSNSIHNKCLKNKIQSTTHTKRDSLWIMDSSHQKPTQQKQQHSLLPTSKNSYYHTHRRHEKTRCQSSKSKISYYMSKSNFNDGTTLCDTTIYPMDYIK